MASMSARTGADEQPMHTDTAYAPYPPRYLVFQCLDPGEAPCSTNVLVLDVGRLKVDRPQVLTKPIGSPRRRAPSFLLSCNDVRRVRLGYDLILSACANS